MCVIKRRAVISEQSGAAIKQQRLSVNGQTNLPQRCKTTDKSHRVIAVIVREKIMLDARALVSKSIHKEAWTPRNNMLVWDRD